MDNSIFTFHVVSFTIFLLACSYRAQNLSVCKFDAIYQLGDSLSDTGNSIIEVPQAYHSRLPYGETIGKATGRASDGYLMIDYIAQSAGLPLLEPYENPNSTFTHGADFAVAGVTALPKEKLTELQLDLGYSNSSLSVQLEWLKKLLSTICNDTKDCQEKLKSSLFMVGIGPNDYGRPFAKGDGIDKVKQTMVPLVVKAIKDGVQTIISCGASKISVLGASQLGCSPAYLTVYAETNSSNYDSLGCLKDYNDFFAYHNKQLQVALEEVRKENPTVTVIYNDIESALFSVLSNLTAFGFKTFQQACCGIGGKYNVSPGLDKMCGAKGVPVCPNPKEHIFWDGGHFSHQASKVLADYLIKEMLPQLKCTA